MASCSFNLFLSVYLRLMCTARIISGDYLNLIFLSFNCCYSCLSALPGHLGNLHHYHLSPVLYFPCLLYSLHSGTGCLINSLLSVCLPPQDTQSTGVVPDDSGSVLMDDTSSQWSAVADTEEERRSALEKSMYGFLSM